VLVLFYCRVTAVLLFVFVMCYCCVTVVLVLWGCFVKAVCLVGYSCPATFYGHSPAVLLL